MKGANLFSQAKWDPSIPVMKGANLFSQAKWDPSIPVMKGANLFSQRARRQTKRATQDYSVGMTYRNSDPANSMKEFMDHEKEKAKQEQYMDKYSQGLTDRQDKYFRKAFKKSLNKYERKFEEQKLKKMQKMKLQEIVQP